MPGYKCSIKERMLYSSCKSRLLDTVEQDFCLEIAKKVSLSHLEVAEELLQGNVLQPNQRRVQVAALPVALTGASF